MRYIVKIDYSDGAKLVLPSVEADDWKTVSDTVLNEHGDKMPSIVKILVMEKHGKTS